MGSWTWPDRSSAASWRSSKRESPKPVSHGVQLEQDMNRRDVPSWENGLSEESLPHLQPEIEGLCLPGWGVELCACTLPLHIRFGTAVPSRPWGQGQLADKHSTVRNTACQVLFS